MSSLIAFSITFKALEALRSMPRELADNPYGLRTDASLLAKGFAELQAESIVPTDKGAALLAALAGLALS